MKQKSIKFNAVLNILSTLVGLVFPVITLPYVTRVLQTVNYGKVVYANSIISYFILLAGLGTANYALREGAAVRDNKKIFNDLVNEIFTLNVISTMISYFLLFVIVMTVPGIREYFWLIALMSLGIMFNTLGVAWVYKANEEYIYITVTGLAVQVLSFVLTFAMVRSPDDYYQYAFIWTLSYIVPGILNFARLRKFVRLRLVFSRRIIKHIKPVLILFATSIASTIYISSDTTILGYLSGDYYTGLYAVSSRIYGVIKNILIAALTVSVPRFSYYYNNHLKTEYAKLMEEIQRLMYFMVFPMAVGLIVFSRDLISFLFGDGYLGSELSLQILSAALIFCMLSWISSQCILIPTKRESLILKATIAGGAVNIVFNIILIPHLYQNAAALTTLISEAMVAVIYLVNTKEYWKHKETWRHLLQCVSASIIMGIIVYFLKSFFTNAIFLEICGCMVAGAGSYFLLLFIARNPILISYIDGIRKKLHR